MANPVDTVIGRYVTPVMKPAGFRKKGRSYRLTGDNGDLIIVEFDVRSEPGVFAVDFVMVPLSRWDWLNRNDLGLSAPGAGAGVVRCDIVPPQHVAHRFRAGPPFSYRWVVDQADEGTRCGTALADALKDRLPLMRQLLDRETVLREASDPDSDIRRLISKELLTLFLRIDAVDATGLEDLLARLEPDQPNRESIVDWARTRVAERT